MPAATNRIDLIKVCEKDFAKLRVLLDAVAPEVALIPDEENTTIKDIVGHRAHWIDLYLGWYFDGEAERPVVMPAPGYKWNDLKRYNADLRRSQADLTWAEARKLLEANHAKLMDFIETHDDTQLYGAPMKGSGNSWTPGRYAEASGASHYRSAAKYIRARLKALSVAL